MNRHAKAATAASTTRQGGRPGRPRRGALACALALVALAGIGASAAIAAPPSVTIEPASEVGIVTAVAKGKVTPEGKYTFFHFEYVSQAQFEAGEWAEAIPTGFGEAGAGSGPASAEVTLEGLAATTTYHLRLVAENEDGHSEAVADPFETAAAVAPSLALKGAESIGRVHAHIAATIDPEGGNTDLHAGPLPILWQLQINREDPDTHEKTSWDLAEASTIEPPDAQSDPNPGEEIEVAKDLEGLKPGSHYFFRLIVSYANKQAITPEGEFDTAPAAAPAATAPQVEALTDASAHLKAEVNPNAPEAAPVADPDVEAAFRTSWHFQCVPPGPSCGSPSGAEIAADDAAHAVEADASGLQPATTYTVKLIATNASGTVESSSVEFTTAAVGPTAIIAVNSPEGPGEATIRGYANPRNSAVSDCHFAYGPTTAYGKSVPCATTPTGNQPALVAAKVSDLPPGTVGHYKLLVETAGGNAESEDSPFAVPAEYQEPECANADKSGAGRLPDCRAWEMVSPPEKQGADVAVSTTRVRAAASESPGLPMAAMFASLGGFGDAVGGGVGIDYLAQRTGAPGTNGWSTHAVTPPQEPLSTALAVGLDPAYQDELTPDFTGGVLRALTPLTEDPNVAGQANLYLRDDLRSPGAGSYQLLSNAGSPQGAINTTTQRPFPAGASTDLHSVIFESRLNLTPDALAGSCDNSSPSESKRCLPKLYKSDDGVVKLLAPSASCPAPGLSGVQLASPCSAAGLGATNLQYTDRTISADGSRVLYTSPVLTSGAPTGQSGAKASKLYLFDDQGTAASGDDTTVQVNASELPVPEEASTARFQTASTDASRVFFTTGERLTEDAPPGVHLYMYDATEPEGERLSLLDVGPNLLTGANVTAVIGASEDGRYVYFGSTEQIVKGATPVFDHAIYLWQDGGGTGSGKISFIGGISVGDERSNTRSVWTNTPSTSRVSPDGRHMLFEVADASGLALGKDHGTCLEGQPTGNSFHSHCAELYTYNAETDQLACASCHLDGTPSEDHAWIDQRSGTGALAATRHKSHALSDDGRRVFFSTADPLVPEDTNGKFDAYEYDTETASLHLLSSGTYKNGSYFMDASANGDDAFFTTPERLAGWDHDGNADLYDARVGGGFPEPAAVTAPCSGDSCRAAAAVAPGVSPTASAGFSGAPNAKQQRCPKGRRAVSSRGKTRCVKPRKHKAHKRATNNRRAGR